MSKRIGKGFQLIAIALLFAIAVVLINQYGMTALRSQVDRMGVWAPIGLFALRFSSVLIPALPGTAYSILAGGLLGFQQGLAVVCLSDLLSCTLSCWLSRRYGRSLVKRLVGERFMNRVDGLSQRHLEQNFFLMTAFLMTGFFDFVAYGVGLARVPWRKFLPALVLSIAISNPPIVAVGASLLEGGKILFLVALLGAFGLALLTGWLRRNAAPVEVEQR